MQIQYELLKTTLKRIFESYKWNSGQIKNSWKISPYKIKKTNKQKMVIIFASDTQIRHLRIIEHILGLKLWDV